jgi:nitrite reductase (NO-forming)
MRPKRTLLLALALVVAAVAGYATAFAKTSVPVQRVTVTMTDFKFKLSKSKVNTGTVIFTVVNRGKITHDFKINGKKTVRLAPGKKATLKVVFKKKGTYAYLCTLPGHAAAGMKGRLGVGAAPTPAPTTTSGGGGGTTTATCTNPQSTTVTVDEYEYGFQLTPVTTIPCGTVTFKQSNSGSVAHNFALEGVPGGTGAVIDPGQSTTFTVTLTPKNYTYICDVSGHAQLGMLGTLTVTG